MEANFNPNPATEEIKKVLNAVAGARTNALKQTKDTQVILGSLLQHEAKRLEKKLGKSHPRVQQLRSSLKRNLNTVRCLEVEQEIDRIQEPEVEVTSTVLLGRVVDEDYRGGSGLKVSLEREPGKVISFLGTVETDSSGYYAIEIDQPTWARLKELAPDGVFVAVSTPKGKQLYRQPQPLKLKERDRALVEVVLNRADITPIGGIKQPTQPPPTVPEREAWVVYGRVTNQAGEGIPGLMVSAIDQDRRYDDKLGSALTNQAGEFRIVFRIQDFREGSEPSLNLYVTVIDVDDNLLFSSQDEVRENASREEVFEIRIQKGDKAS